MKKKYFIKKCFHLISVVQFVVATVYIEVKSYEIPASMLTALPQVGTDSGGSFKFLTCLNAVSLEVC